jgi:hypothetical protein
VIRIKTIYSSLDSRLELYDARTLLAADDGRIVLQVAAQTTHWFRIRAHTPSSPGLEPFGAYLIQVHVEAPTP